MAGYIGSEDFPLEKMGEWIHVEADMHFMPIALIRNERMNIVGQGIIEVRGIVQVESEAGSIGLCETHVPLPLVMRWIEDEIEDEDD